MRTMHFHSAHDSSSGPSVRTMNHLQHYPTECIRRPSERVYRYHSKFRIGVNKTKTYLIHYFDGVQCSVFTFAVYSFRQHLNLFRSDFRFGCCLYILQFSMECPDEHATCAAVLHFNGLFEDKTI